MSKEVQIPIQPVEKPILCSPYNEPDQHWLYDTKSGIPSENPGRRNASYWFKSERTGTAQMSLLTEEESDDLPLVNFLRDDVRRWRGDRGASAWQGANETTKQLLRHWWREDRSRRLFFCQLEAVETIIYIREILAAGKKPRWKTKLTADDYEQLMKGINPRPQEWIANVAQHPKLVDTPNEADLKPLTRYACKMATGSGKTVVMAMLIAWAFCNRGRVPGDTRYSRRAVVVCPNLTIKERLQVLRPSLPGNYYEEFDIVPMTLRPELAKGKVLVTNWHWFSPESEHTESGKSFIVVNKGQEDPEAFTRNRLEDLYDDEPLMVLNDEAHHAYRPAKLDEDERLSAEEKEDREEATVWISGLDKINAACGISFCVDLSATPFYIHGSGYSEGSPFPWIVSDFSLVDAIESGITKIPRLPAIDNTGRPDPKYFELWKHITRDLKAGERLNGGQPKPEVVFRKAEDALQMLAGEWKERFEEMQAATPGQERVPPVMIIVCANTSIANHFHRAISGEEIIEIEDIEEDDDEDQPKRKKKAKTRKQYGKGGVFPELLSNQEGAEVTLRIDSNLLKDAESENPKATKKEAAEELRRIVGTVGKRGQPGEKVRCVVSVNMLSEGWDANNVTHILGLRAFGSQLLCEQVVGRGLRRLDYAVDPETGLLNPEYVDIFGVPFSLIPFKGREPGKPTNGDDKPKNEVMALPERKQFEIRFPIVEGYAVALKRNLIKCDVSEIERTGLDPWLVPTAAFLRPQIAYQIGSPSAYGGFGFEHVDREAYYNSNHPQTIEFEMAKEVVRLLTEGAHPGKESLRRQARNALFPQVLRAVQEYVRTRVDFNGLHPCEIGLQTYAQRIVKLLVAAIEPDDEQGEAPLIPLLNRYKQIGTTAQVHFKTVKPVQATQKSHINSVACDTNSWEQAAMFQLEASPHVICYAKNDRLEFNIPYEFYENQQVYEPDFLVKLTSGVTLVVEIKGQTHAETDAKHQAAKRWVSAVNNWGKLGRWEFLVNRDPQKLGKQITALIG
jgi:type III restriction enzyme